MAGHRQLADLAEIAAVAADATPEAEKARQDAEQLRSQLAEAAHMRALADRLAARPQLGRDVFGCDEPEAPVRTAPAKGDLLDLLIAGLVVYDAPVAPVQPVYRPMVRTLLSVQVALTWLRSLLAAHPDGGELAQFLPAQTALTKEPTLHSRAALASTFLAGLELTKQEAAQMAQDEDFGDIQLQAVD